MSGSSYDRMAFDGDRLVARVTYVGTPSDMITVAGGGDNFYAYGGGGGGGGGVYWTTIVNPADSTNHHPVPPRLSVELVPKTCWWSNVRNNVSKAEWEKCKAFVRNRSKNKCEICGGQGKNWPIECHEIWHYDDHTHVQMLIDLIALCPSCHQVKHFGRSEAVGKGEATFKHLAEVNGWDRATTAQYLADVNVTWATRSQHDWRLNVDFLGLIGVKVPEKLDREQGAIMAGRAMDGSPLTPGVNVDAMDIAAGLARMRVLGYEHPNHAMEVEYNLMRWARGEEEEADRSMSKSLSGVRYTDWRVILAVAIAAGQPDVTVDHHNERAGKLGWFNDL